MHVGSMQTNILHSNPLKCFYMEENQMFKIAPLNKALCNRGAPLLHFDARLQLF